MLSSLLKLNSGTWLKSLILMLISINVNAQENYADSARLFLTDQFDRCHKVSFVYLNGNDACNIFIPHAEGDGNNFTKITQQYRENHDSWQSNGLLIYKPTPSDSNGYAAWAYTWGVDNFGQFPGFDMAGADSLIFFVKGKGTIEVIVGGTNRPPFKNASFFYEDGVDARSTGYITLNQDTAWEKHVLYLSDDRFWVFKGPREGANNKFPKWGLYKDFYDCSEYLNVSLDSIDENGEDCIAVTWMRPDSVIKSNNYYIKNCYGGFGLLSPNINISDWQLGNAQGYDLLGLDSICFKAKLNKPGNIEINFNCKDCPGGKMLDTFSIDTLWKKFYLPIPDSLHFSKTNVGFGLALKPAFTPDSITLFLDSIYYVGTTLKTRFDSLITGAKFVLPSSINPDSAIVYFDSIFFNRPRLDEPRFPQSFLLPNSDSLFATQQMSAHTYDAGLTIIALLAEYYKSVHQSWLESAEKIGDAFLFAMENDRYFHDGRLRNVYSAGLTYDNLNRARMSGYWNEKKGIWFEDSYEVGTATGNVAWAALSLISLYEANQKVKYLDAAERLANWVITNTWVTQGFSGGFENWDENQLRLLYTATEHCIDLTAVFLRLYNLTQKTSYKEAADHANEFVLSMWDPINGKFFTGTNDDGAINKDVIPTDLQVWYLLANNDRNSDFTRSYHWAKDSCFVSNHTHPGDPHNYIGFDFSLDTTLTLDGVGYEFTGQMATCACWLGDSIFYRELIEELDYIQLNGPRNNEKGIIAACHDSLSTGFRWQYHNILHAGGATLWYLFAKERINPYYNPKFPFDCNIHVSTHTIAGSP
ncbi:MAG: hypothetical protein WBP41_12340, partial [Saprospiraceae bacterium]